MAERRNPDSDPDTGKRFQDFLAGCPAADEPPSGLVVAGMVLRSAAEGRFVLQTGQARHEVPVEAVEDFRVLGGGGAGTRMAQLTLNRERLGADLAGALDQAGGGGAKPPLDKPGPLDKAPFVDKQPPFDTLKEPPQDKLPPLDKQPPFDTLKEPADDTVKELPKDPIQDTIKEVPKDPIHDTWKELPKDPIQDTLKELGKDPIQDTVKEAGKDPIQDTLKEAIKDPIQDGGGGNTGIADTLAENIPGGGLPGGPEMRAAAMTAAKPPVGDKVPTFDTLKEVGGGDTLKEQPFDTLKEPAGDTLKEQPFDTLKELGGGDTLKEQPFDTLKEPPGDTLKEQPFDTLKEVGGGDTLKEVTGGDTLKEQPFDTLKEVGGGDTVKEIGKDPIGDGGGTGIADTLVEGGFPQNPGQPVFGGEMGLGPAPFVLATPHQAPQGALAQQYLAAQMARGTLGL